MTHLMCTGSLVSTLALSSSVAGTLSSTGSTLTWAFLGGQPFPLFLPAIFAMSTWALRTVEGDGMGEEMAWERRWHGRGDGMGEEMAWERRWHGRGDGMGE